MITSDAALAAAAEAVLRTNDLGDYTRPSPRLYPHQWNWDSAFIAVGWGHLDWLRATREVESLLAGQWINGMVPHIRYNPAVRDYTPGPENWPGVPVRHPGERTSGITQPPVLASAVSLLGLMQPDVDIRMTWWRRVYEPLRASVRFFPERRTAGGSPLILVLHPWESGLDNSPRWDHLVGLGLKPSRSYRRTDTTVVQAAERPTAADYDLYMYLVEVITGAGYELPEVLACSPFAVYDALFNAIWYQAATDLNSIAAALDEPPPLPQEELEAFREAYRRTLWSEEAQLFRDYDLQRGAQIPVDTVAGLVAIFAGLIDAGQAAAMAARYRRRSHGCRLLPSVPPDQPGFDPARYWRGPVWVNINWLLLRGLERLGLREEARELAEETLDLVRTGGFYEYFHAYTGEGRGGQDFSWTAALVLDLLHRPVV
ncbi:MAG: trehalase family glycosidase [Armatimonadota bacterium]|nr:trehalase family glycosidase [Armatimonadota bacterium]MDR7463628.1 trehalase family glycosidase [Armatimonadota bacterium]MDR7469837.1 trehalase family glycosidase [Armatimonadota bacterium]MDR7475202.1 trehalase family glycosidase [Armatimonadota bacterium]MDR7540076.1 trehalase family glycosidase [Armatimonadota bacterium]